MCYQCPSKVLQNGSSSRLLRKLDAFNLNLNVLAMYSRMLKHVLADVFKQHFRDEDVKQQFHNRSCHTQFSHLNYDEQHFYK